MIEQLDRIDTAIDEWLVHLGAVILKLADVSRAGAERDALAKAVRQFSTCAADSKDGRVHKLAIELEAIQRLHVAPRLKPHLHLVVNR